VCPANSFLASLASYINGDCKAEIYMDSKYRTCDWCTGNPEKSIDGFEPVRCDAAALPPF